MEPTFRLYREQDLKSVENFWNANIFVNFPVWKKIIEGVEEKLKAYRNIPLNDELMHDDHQGVLKRVELAKRWQLIEEDTFYDGMPLREWLHGKFIK